MLVTYVYSHCNIYNILIYFCNIHMKHLQRTSETSKTIENICLQHVLSVQHLLAEVARCGDNDLPGGELQQRQHLGTAGDGIGNIRKVTVPMIGK